LGLYLIADWSDWAILGTLWTFARAAFALGIVIFVHELGHFAVAKWCGVKCEKFYLGFDIYGLKLAKFRWGETEYGIGILPLGGYVKMLGQDDNPARAAEERRRSQIPIGTDVAGSEMAPDPAGYALDPRSYMAQSVPKRMAIISAGVIMNVIFALVAATVAYCIGVKDIACVIGDVVPGEAAWQADMRGGDEVLQIGDQVPKYPLRYRDLMHAVVLGDLREGVKFKLQRPGVDDPFWVTVYPATGEERDRLAPTIGVISGVTTQLADKTPVEPGTPAASAKKFEPGDTIVEINGTPVAAYADIERMLAQHASEPLQIVVDRKVIDDESQSASAPAQREPKRDTVEVAPNPMRTLGLVMKIGKITAVQDDSPAAKAGVRAGDFIKKINGQDVGDPLTLSDRLQNGEFGKSVTLELTRKDEQKTESVPMDLRDVTWYEKPAAPGSSMSLPSLGIAYRVLNIVDHAEASGPAGRATFRAAGKDAQSVKIQAEDAIVEAAMIFPEEPPRDWGKQKWPPTIDPIKFSDQAPNWPYFNHLLQELPEGTKVKLTLKGADDKAGPTAELAAVESKDFFNPERGFIHESKTIETKAESPIAAVPIALRETKESLLQVYSFLRRIGSQVSVKALGGPVTIFQQAGAAANQGFADLLIFLTMLSANLAVINFLPIPLLDGGHMVFLALEGIFRKPVSERVVVAFHYLGFVFILTLMLFVLGLDLGIISRHG
jgi:regulator of sigma E protease